MRALVAAAFLTVVVAVGPAVAAPPHPDPPPEAKGKNATVSGGYWVDALLYDAHDRLVHGARARCRYRTGHPRRCFIIRVRVR